MKRNSMDYKRNAKDFSHNGRNATDCSICKKSIYKEDENWYHYSGIPTNPHTAQPGEVFTTKPYIHIPPRGHLKKK